MMVISRKVKRVTDPLDEKVKICLCGGTDRRRTSTASSGSEHDAGSNCLSDLIHGFLESDEGRLPPENDPENSDGGDEFDLETTVEMLQDLLKVKDRFRLKLLSTVAKAVEAFQGLKSNRSGFRRAVMTYLRDSGYNAGMCKTKWETLGGLTGGNYEFIDVVVESERGTKRYFVEIDLEGEFEIARATDQYGKLLKIMPRIYVGKSEEMKQIVRLVSDAAKRSLHSRNLHLPPWRKNRYMQTKWFGPYKRTTQSQTTPSFRPEFEARCRSVGFFAVPTVSVSQPHR